MILRGVSFRPVMCASGALNFFGQGYPIHKKLRCLGLTFKGCGFVAKTVTVSDRTGNMPLKDLEGTPQETLPRCIKVYPFQAATLNAVGLSNKGLRELLDRGLWQTHPESFFISFMAVESDPGKRLTEFQVFTSWLGESLPAFQAKIGVELNFSCPNTGHELLALIREIEAALDVVAKLGVPVQIKLNALAYPREVKSLLQHDACDALVMGNTIPWGELADRISWRRYSRFWLGKSPLASLRGGGLSGKPLLPIICDWIHDARDYGVEKPIWACGGIMHHSSVDKVWRAGASGIQIGTVALTRPWRIRSIISRAYEVFE